ADRPDDRAGEHPPRRRRDPVPPGRGGPRQRGGGGRRLHRGAGGPGRRMSDLTRLTARAMAERLRAGEVPSRGLAVAHLDAAEAGNHALNAWLTIDRDEALRQADDADARLRATGGAGEHPLLGIPIALKDLISVRGGQCTAGSRILEGYIAPYDAH